MVINHSISFQGVCKGWSKLDRSVQCRLAEAKEGRLSQREEGRLDEMVRALGLRARGSGSGSDTAGGGRGGGFGMGGGGGGWGEWFMGGGGGSVTPKKPKRKTHIFSFFFSMRDVVYYRLFFPSRPRMAWRPSEQPEQQSEAEASAEERPASLPGNDDCCHAKALKKLQGLRKKNFISFCFPRSRKAVFHLDMRDRRSFSSSVDRAMAPGGGLDASSADPYYLGEAFDQMGGRAVMERIRNLTAEAPERVPMLRQVKDTRKHTTV